MIDRGTTCCLWCNRFFPAARRGRFEKQFCTPTCRAEFHSACRRWMQEAIRSGLLSVSNLKDVAATTPPRDRVQNAVSPSCTTAGAPSGGETAP